MQDSIDPKRLTRSRRTALLAATLVTGILLAGCGESSPSPTAGTLGGATTPAASPASAGPTGPGAGPPNALAFANCMRANGVPNFPDPQAGGGFLFSTAGINPAAPAVKAAQAKCQKFAPQPPGGPSGGGSSVPPQEQAHALAQLRTVALCMRQHGVSDFPDPRTTRPPNLSPGQYSVITDYEGAFLLFPATIDMQSPAWEQAATACGPLAESFNHAHH
jgi:hypothetical protein